MKLLTDGVEFTLNYQEPATNTDGTQLEDLHHTSVYYDIGAGPVNVVDLPASLSAGGGSVAYTFQVPVLPGEVKSVVVSATATDNNGNSSEPASAGAVLVDRVAPAPPFSLELS